MRFSRRGPGNEHRGESAEPYEGGEGRNPDVVTVVVSGEESHYDAQGRGEGRVRLPIFVLPCVRLRSRSPVVAKAKDARDVIRSLKRNGGICEILSPG